MKFEIKELISKGANSVVYKGSRLHSSADDDLSKSSSIVAIKIIAKKDVETLSADDTSSVHSRLSSNTCYTFSNEVNILKTLHHENIINFIGTFVSVDSFFIVMDYVEGQPLMINDNIITYSEDDCKILFRQLCSAISYLHQNFIVHKDIKPQNIIVSRKLKLTVCDFGAASRISSNKGEKIVGVDDLTNRIAGTALFLPPESFNNSMLYNGKPADIWSMGITLYCILTGEVPFRSTNEIKFLKNNVCLPNRFKNNLVINIIARILDPIVVRRPTAKMLLGDPWLLSSSYNNNPINPTSTRRMLFRKSLPIDLRLERSQSALNPNATFESNLNLATSTKKPEQLDLTLIQNLKPSLNKDESPTGGKRKLRRSFTLFSPRLT